VSRIPILALFITFIALPELGFSQKHEYVGGLEGMKLETQSRVRLGTYFVLPDTQYFPDADNGNGPGFLMQDIVGTAEWICNNKEKWDIVGVVHEGDMINRPDLNPEEYALLAPIWDIFDSCGLPYLPTIGNHDIYTGTSGLPNTLPQCDDVDDMKFQEYEDAFGVSGTHALESKSWFGGRGPDFVNSEGTWESGAVWITTLRPGMAAISIPWCAAHQTSEAEFAATLAWADTVVSSNPETLFVLASHVHGFQYPSVTAATNQTFIDLIDDNPNIALATTGHVNDQSATVDFNAVDPASGCTGCFITSSLNFQDFNRDEDWYNAQGKVTVNPATRTICIQSWRVFQTSPIDPPEFDITDGVGVDDLETCVSLRPGDFF
jgi:hypothetical protein